MSFFLFQNKRGNGLSNKLLATLFLLLGLSIISMGLSIGGYFGRFPMLVSLDDGFILTYGPLILLFTRSIIIKDFEFKAQHLRHFIPFLVVTGIIAYTILTSDLSISGINSNLISFLEIGLLTHSAIYAFKARWEIHNALDTASNNYSNILTDHIDWVNFIVNSFLVILFTTIIHASTPFLKSTVGLLISLSIFIAYLFYFVNRVVLRMLNQASKNSGVITQVEIRQSEKYTGSNLSDEQIEIYKKKISDHFKEFKPYLEDSITLKNLADTLSLSPKRLSQVINSGYSMRFFDLINKNRIEHAVHLIEMKDSKSTIQEIMYQSGFNSKSSFNTAFKKFTGKTPSEYKKDVKKGATS